MERSIQKEALDELSKFLTQGNPIQRLRALWTMHAIQGDSSAIAKLLLNNSDESVRVWAIRFITEPQKIAAQTDQLLHALAKSEQSGFVRLNLAAALQRLPVDRRIPIALALSAHGADSQDRAIPKMLWYGIEPIVSQYPDRIRELLDTCQIPTIRQNTARRLIVQSNPRQNGTTLILSYLADQKNPEVQYDLLVGIQMAYAGRRNVAMPPEWKQIAPKLLASESNLVREKATEIAVLYQDRDAIELLRNRLESNQETLASRRRALEILQQQQSDTLVSPLLKLLDHPELRGDAIRALAAFSQPEIANAIVGRYSSFTESERQDAITTLASRPQFALKMMEAIQKQVIHRQDVSLVVVRQMQGYRDAQVKVEFQKIWSIVGSTSAERVKKANELRTKYTPEVMKSANLSNGRRLYAQNCASCHRLFDDGGLIGPELTGSQRAKLDYVLENVLDPNAIVPKDYQVTIIELDSGRLLNGIVKEESEKTVTLQTTNEKITFPKSEIVSRTQASHSLMPEGILEKLNEAEVRDLLAYLASPAQVPLPKE
ncbi:c-type cytochrome [Tuwongella immobilis]|nr:c-type cytochrome [Tuwongella immobilis]